MRNLIIGIILVSTTFAETLDLKIRFDVMEAQRDFLVAKINYDKALLNLNLKVETAKKICTDKKLIYNPDKIECQPVTK